MRAKLGERDRPLRCAATELEDVQAGDLAEDLELRFRDLRGAPGETATVPELFAVTSLVFVAVRVPHLSIAGGMLGQVGRGIVFGSHATHGIWRAGARACVGAPRSLRDTPRLPPRPIL